MLASCNVVHQLAYCYLHIGGVPPLSSIQARVRILQFAFQSIISMGIDLVV